MKKRRRQEEEEKRMKEERKREPNVKIRGNYEGRAEGRWGREGRTNKKELGDRNGRGGPGSF